MTVSRSSESTGSEKVIRMLVVISTLVAESAGMTDTTVGGVLSLVSSPVPLSEQDEPIPTMKAKSMIELSRKLWSLIALTS